MDEKTFHFITLMIQTGILSITVAAIWKLSAVVTEFQIVKTTQADHILEDKQKFDKVDEAIASLQQRTSRTEGRLNGHAHL